MMNSLTTKTAVIEEAINKSRKTFVSEELRLSRKNVSQITFEKFLQLLDNDLEIQVESYHYGFKVFGVKLTDPLSLRTKWLTFDGWDLCLKVSHECEGDLKVLSPKSYEYHFPINDISTLKTILQNEVTLLAKTRV